MLYAPTLRYGFVYDDYHWVRPYSFHEVLSSFWGTWDAAHLEVAFYRPLTVMVYAVRFLVFGFNAGAYHGASIFFFALAAALFGAMLLRLFRSRALAFAGAGLLLIHPAVTDSLVAWTINQYQLAEVVLFLCALHWWLTCEGKTVRWWLPLLLLSTLCFLFKEDGIMAIVALLIIGVIGARVLNRPLAPPPMIYPIVCAMIGVLALLHFAALRGIVGGYGTPPFGTILHNLVLGPRRILLGRYGPEWAKGFNICVTTAITLLGVSVAFVRKNARATFLILSGVTILTVFDLPLALVGRTDQHFLPVHFLAVGHVFILLGALDALAQAATTVRIGRITPGAILALTGAVVFVGLLFIPPHLQTSATPAHLNTNSDGTFFLTETDPAGNQFAWTKGRASFVLDFLPRKPIRLIAEMRSAAVAGGPDQPVHLLVNGQEVGRLQPNPRDASFQSLALAFTPPPSSTGRMKVEFVTATFRAPDGRDLGTMIRTVTIDKREAWSGIERRRWLLWALPFLAIVAMVCHRVAARSRRAIFAIGAVAAGTIGCLCVAVVLFLFARIGVLDKNRYGAWVLGCVVLEALWIVGTVGLLWAQISEPIRNRVRDRFSTMRASSHAMNPRSITPSAATMILLIVVMTAALNMVIIARENTLDWHPYSEFTLRYDKLVAGWGDKVPEELRQTLAHK